MDKFFRFITIFTLVGLLGGTAWAVDQMTSAPKTAAVAKTANQAKPATTTTATSYTFDPDHTYILWHINHFGFSNPSGKWMANGTLVLDQTRPQNSKVDATVQINTVVTGIPELDKHLQTADFFDSAKYPSAHFVSTKVIVTGRNTAKLEGNLTLHGVTKPLVLYVKLNKIGISPITNKQTVGFTASGTLDRSDYGMKTYLPGLGNKVQLEVEAEAAH